MRGERAKTLAVRNAFGLYRLFMEIISSALMKQASTAWLNGDNVIKSICHPEPVA
jgi:hypothetical protein